MEAKDFRVIHSKPCREPVELKDPSGLHSILLSGLSRRVKEKKITPIKQSLCRRKSFRNVTAFAEWPHKGGC